MMEYIMNPLDDRGLFFILNAFCCCCHLFVL